MVPQLEQLGFTRNEANVYLASIKLGPSSVQQLATATGLNRITVHSICEKFEKLQIVYVTLEGKRRRIVAMEPEYLENLLQKENEILAQKQNALQSILPSMQEMFRRQSRGMQIRTFQGEKGYEEICEDVLRTRGDMYEYADIDALNKVIGPYLAQDYLPRKHKLKIKTKFLLKDSKTAREYIKKNYLDYPDPAPMEAKFIDPKVFKLDAYFTVYGDKLTILTPETLSGMILHDKSSIQTFLPFYNFVWERAGKAVKNF